MNQVRSSNFDLQVMAKQVMLERGFQPDFPAAAEQQVKDLQAHPPHVAAENSVLDLRDLLWSSIDNDTSRDLDQIEVAEKQADGQTKIRVAIADVDAYVPKGTPIDQHAADQTCSVYAAVHTFPMLPEELSTGLTSLLETGDRLAMVTEFVVDSDGCVNSGQVYPALVHNKAQLTYNAVGAWLEGGAAPPKVAASQDLQEQLQLQDEIAQSLRRQRYRNGALYLDTAEAQPIVIDQQVVGVSSEQHNRASELIEDFMIAANGVVARELKDICSLRRIVRTPKRWDRIVQLAAEHGGHLPAEPDSKALNDFLIQRREADPDHFADVSLTVIKLIGSGEYVLERPGEPEQGHFGLAVQDYTHSTAPNRRFPDLVTQRLLKAKLAKKPSPYSEAELTTIAKNCTDKEDDARKVEREMAKRLAAVAMSKRIGEQFNAVVTGVTQRGTFVRVLDPHIEGLLARGQEGLDVGDRLKVKLIRTDVQHGYIDFAKV
jgi:VacB/RNase II family 3'-5' exoribonuclease